MLAASSDVVSHGRVSGMERTRLETERMQESLSMDV